jgi:hypothetical protein
MSKGSEELRLTQKARAVADKVAKEINNLNSGTFTSTKYPKQALLELVIKELENRV